MIGFLTGTVTPVTSADWSAVMTNLQAQISVTTIVEVLAVLVGAGVGMAFMWWGVRKLIKVIMNGLKGRLHL